MPIFGKLQLDSIQKEDIKTFLSNKRQEKVKRTGKKLSINRVKRIKAVLLGIFSSAVDDHEIASNPADRLGHASIRITVDTYYKWIAGTHQDQVAELDKLGIPAPSCTPAAPTENEGVKQDA